MYVNIIVRPCVYSPGLVKRVYTRRLAFRDEDVTRGVSEYIILLNK